MSAGNLRINIRDISFSNKGITISQFDSAPVRIHDMLCRDSMSWTIGFCFPADDLYPGKRVLEQMIRPSFNLRSPQREREKCPILLKNYAKSLLGMT